MITLCSNVNGLGHNYLDYYKESIVKNTKLVSEVMICDIDAQEGFIKEEKIRGIRFLHFAHPNVFVINDALQPHKTIRVFKPNRESEVSVVATYVAHAFGLDECIKRATNDYIYTCDPDLLFLDAAEEAYLELMNKYDIKFIGASHHAAILYSSGYFPNPVNFMTKKQYMPTKEFFDKKLLIKDCITIEKPEGFDEFMRDKFFFQKEIPEFKNLFPKPDGIFDTGVNIYIWSEHIKARWLAFQTLDIHTYTTKCYRNNFGLKDNLPKITKKGNLFWHATGGQDPKQLYWDDFMKTYYEKIKQ